MSTPMKIVSGLLLVIALFAAGQFVYVNIVIPWPYRDELKACLAAARALDTVGKIEDAETRCFRTYPHFN